MRLVPFLVLLLAAPAFGQTALPASTDGLIPVVWLCVSGNCLDGEGVATFTSVDGTETTYTGHMKTGRPHGRGADVRSNGIRHEGEYADGWASGEGVRTFPNGARFEGTLRNDSFVSGRYAYPSGNVYVGDFDRGRSGIGTLTQSNGVSHTGHWENDQPVGTHRAHKLDGTTPCILFRDGEFVGEVDEARMAADGFTCGDVF